LIDGKLPGDVWSTYLLFGALFTVGGMFLFRQRKPRPSGR